MESKCVRFTTHLHQIEQPYIYCTCGCKNCFDNKTEGAIIHCPKMGLLEEEGNVGWGKCKKFDLTKESWGAVGVMLHVFLLCVCSPIYFSLFLIISNNALFSI